MGMAFDSSQITKFLRDLSGQQTFKLTFSYNGKEYKTVFLASHTIEDGKDVIIVDNGCINLIFEFMNFVGSIQAENGVNGRIDDADGKKSCFLPKLISDPRTMGGSRISAGDVLQTLKSKLALIFPVDGFPIQLVDGIHIDPTSLGVGSSTMVSPFHIVRGRDAYYERFGYRSEKISELKKGIRGLTWMDIDFTEPMKDIITDYNITKNIEKTYDDDDLLTDIMKAISWEDEVAYNESHRSSLSSTVFQLYAWTQGIMMEQSDQWSFKNIWTFELDPDSEEWKQYDAALIFTSFAPTVSGGQRKYKKIRGKTRVKAKGKTRGKRGSTKRLTRRR